MAEQTWKPRSVEDTVDAGVHVVVAAMRLSGAVNAPSLSLGSLRKLGVTPDSLGPEIKKAAIRSPSREDPERAKMDREARRRRKEKKAKEKRHQKKERRRRKKKERLSSSSPCSSASGSDSAESAPKRRKISGSGDADAEAFGAAASEPGPPLSNSSEPSGTDDEQVDVDAAAKVVVQGLQAGDLSLLPRVPGLLLSASAEWQQAICCVIATLTPNSRDPEGRVRASVRAAGAIPPLVELLASTSIEVQHQAARALHNCTSKNPENKEAVAEAGAIPRLLSLAKSGSSTVREQAICVMRNLTGGSAANKALFAKSGGIPVLVSVMHANVNLAVQAHISVVLNNLAFNCPERRLAIAETGALPSLVALLGQAGGSEVQKEAASTLRTLAVDTPKLCVDMAGAKVAVLLAPLLKAEDPEVVKRAVALRDALRKYGGPGVRAALDSVSIA